jgi:hypothetical protein
MGKISRKLANRFRKSRKLTERLGRQVREETGPVAKDVKSIQQLIEEEGHDALHAAYVAAQNITSFFAEAVSVFDEFDGYCEVVGSAQDEYMPGGPPISPLTNSYFTTWAFFDVRFGPDLETIGTCLMDLADIVEMDPFMVETLRRLQDSRMGIYEHCGWDGSRVCLRELVTGDEFECCVPAGYEGKQGELWFIRLCPPLGDLFDYHLAFTTPYVLTEANKSDWTAYLKKWMMQIDSDDERAALDEFLKYGRDARSWSEYIFLGYHHHRPDAIFLAGLPDVKDSLPHA